MTPETIKVMMVVFMVWGVAVGLKSMHSLSSRKPYVFRIWDGGMLRAGRTLNRPGTIVRAGVGCAMFAWCGAILGGAYMSSYATLIAVGIALAALISDFINSEPA